MPASCLVPGSFDLIISCSVPPDEDQCARNTCEWFDNFERHGFGLRSRYEIRTCISILWRPNSLHKPARFGILLGGVHEVHTVMTSVCRMSLSSFDAASQLMCVFSLLSLMVQDFLHLHAALRFMFPETRPRRGRKIFTYISCPQMSGGSDVPTCLGANWRSQQVQNSSCLWKYSRVI